MLVLVVSLFDGFECFDDVFVRFGDFETERGFDPAVVIVGDGETADHPLVDLCAFKAGDVRVGMPDVGEEPGNVIGVVSGDVEERFVSFGGFVLFDLLMGDADEHLAGVAQAHDDLLEEICKLAPILNAKRFGGVGDFRFLTTDFRDEYVGEGCEGIKDDRFDVG